MAISPSRHFIIAREGWPYVFVVLGLAVFSHYQFGWAGSLPLLLPAAVLFYAFRDPGRPVPPAPLAVICPADGKIVSVRKIHDNYLDRTAIMISVRMNALGIYSARSPIEGKVIKQWFLPRDADNDVRYVQWIQTDEKDDVVLCMSGNVLALRPHCYVQSGERIGQGHRCGYIPFGARIDVLVPENSRIDIESGASVLAGTQVIATLVH